MPIYNIAGISDTHGTDETGVVQVGNIRKGEMTEKKTRNGQVVEYPKNLDYFRVVFRDDLDDLRIAFNKYTLTDEPRKIRVQLAYPTLEDSWWAWNSIYKSGGMLGLNDGIWWNYLRDTSTNNVLVSDYMLTPHGMDKMADGMLVGFQLGDLEAAFDQYRISYHQEGLKLPRSWQKVEAVIKREGGENCPPALLFDPAIPIYETEKNQYFSSTEGRLMVTMPHIPSFTSFHLLQFKTGSINDIRTLSRNLAQIAGQASVFDSEQGSIPLDSIPMQLIRREETISKPIGGKLVKSPEWLVHIETLPDWQHMVDEMKVKRTIFLIQAKYDQQFDGLSMTTQGNLLPESSPVQVVSKEPEPEEGIHPYAAHSVDAYEDKILVTEDRPNPMVDDPAWNDDLAVPPPDEDVIPGAPEPEPAPKPKAKKAVAKPKATATKLKTRDVPEKVQEGSYHAAIDLLNDKTAKIGASEFWGYAYGMGFSQKEAEPFLTSDDWRACLEAITDAYVKRADE